MQTTKRPSARILALLLTVAMLCSLLPMSVFAADGVAESHSEITELIDTTQFNSNTSCLEHGHQGSTPCWKWNSVPARLELNGVKATAGIKIDTSSSEITLASNTVNTVSSSVVDIPAIDVTLFNGLDYALNITGAGTLKVTSAGVGIKVQSQGNRTLISNSAKLIIKATDSAIWTKGSLAMQEATLVAESTATKDNRHTIQVAQAAPGFSTIDINNSTVSGKNTTSGGQMPFSAEPALLGCTSVAAAWDNTEGKEARYVPFARQSVRWDTLDLTTIAPDNTMGATYNTNGNSNIYTHNKQKWTYHTTSTGTPVLTLNGVDFDVESGHAIVAPTDTALTIRVNPGTNNTVKAQTIVDENDITMAGIYSESQQQATIEKPAGDGESNLTVEGGMGIRIANTATVLNGVNLNIKGNASGNSDFAYYGSGLTIQSGTLRATSPGKAAVCLVGDAGLLPEGCTILGSLNQNADEASLTPATFLSNAGTIKMGSDGAGETAKTVKIIPPIPTIVVGGNDATEGYGTADGQTLQKAFTDIPDGGIVKLGAAINTATTTITHSAEKAVTLDLNGQTWTSAVTTTDAALKVSGKASLTVKDSGDDGTLLNNVSDGKAITQCGTGKLTIEDGTINADSTAIYNGTGNASSVSGILTISGGKVTSQNGHAIYNNHGGDITISAGTVETNAAMGSAIYAGNPSKITISGTAVVTSKNSDTDRGTILIPATAPTPAKILLDIKGGTVSNTASPSAGNAINFAGIGYTVDNLSSYYSKTGGTVTGKIKPTVSPIVVGGSVSDATPGYTTADATTLQAAFTDIPAGGTVKLGANITLDSSITLSGDKAVTLDLNGKQLTGSLGSGQSLLRLLDTSSVTIMDSGTNGTLSNTNSEGRALTNAGTGTITITGGTVKALKDAIWNNESGGDITISGGTVKGETDSAITNNEVSSKITISGDAVVTSSTSNAEYGTITIFSDAPNSATTLLEITGGTVENTASPVGNAIHFAGDGYTPDNVSGYYSQTDGTVIGKIKPAPPVASIGSSKYGTLEEAFTAANNNQTVKIESDLTLKNGVELTADNLKNVTLDLNGKTVSITGAASKSDGDGKNATALNLEKVVLTITDSADTKGLLTLTSADSSAGITSDSSVTISSAIVQSVGSNGIVLGVVGGGLGGATYTEANLTITNDAVLTSASSPTSGDAIIAHQFIMDSGNVTATGGSRGISIRDAMDISGGTLTASGTVQALQAKGNLTIGPDLFAKYNTATGSNPATYLGKTHVANAFGYNSLYQGETGTDAIVKDVRISSSAASIGDTTYKTLEEALEAATNDQTVKIESDLTLTNGVDVTSALVKNVTLDLNGKTVSMTGSAADDGNTTALKLDKIALTITDSADTKGSLSLTGTNASEAIYSDSDITISKAHVEATGNSGADGSIVTDGTLKITELAELEASLSSPNASVIYAGHFIMDSGKATILGSTSGITGISTEGDITITGGTLTVTVDTSPLAALLAGGTLTLTNVAAKYNTGTSETPNYTGDAHVGTYTINATDYETIYEEATGTTIATDVKIVQTAASIDGTTYKTLEEALSATTDGQTVTIESNLTLTNGVELTADNLKNVTLDLNGKTVSITGSTEDSANKTALKLDKVELTITDSADTKGSLSLTGKGDGVAYDANADLTISDAIVHTTAGTSAAHGIKVSATGLGINIEENATLTVTTSATPSVGILTYDFNMDSGEVSIEASKNTSGGSALTALNDITITGGTLTAIGSTRTLLAGGNIVLTDMLAKYNTAESGTATYTGETHVGTYTTDGTDYKTIYKEATGTTIAKDIQIGAASADKTALSAAITNAKTIMANTVISVSNGSDVSTSTYWVLPAIMSAAKDALKEAEDMLAKDSATQTEIDNATTTLNAKVNLEFKPAKKLGTKSSGGSTGGGGSGGSGNSGSTTTPSKPTEAVKGESNTNATVDNGKANANISEKNVSDAVQAAKDEAAKKGVTAGEVTAVINVKTGSDDVNTVSVNLPKSVQEQVINGKIGNLAIVIDKPDISIGMNLATITEMNKQAKADIALSATRMDASKLSDEAKTVIGNRPAFDLKASYENGSKSVTNFGNGTVSIAIPYTLQSGEVADGVYAVYVDDNGKANTISGSKYDASAKVLRFNTNHFSVYGIGYQAPAQTGFVDVAGHWAKSDIDFVVERGLMNGTSDTTFSPNGSMTRGMFVTVLGRLAKVDTNAYQTSKFTDVSTSMYYAPYVNWAAEKGITKGTSATTFSPEQAISRQEMAVFMNSFAKVQGYTVKNTNEAIQFADNASIATWASEAVKTMQMAGILNGKDGNKFDPLGTATRAEISSMLHRFVQTVVD